MVTVIKQTMLRRKAEREIKVQNEQLTAILSATPLGIFQVRNASHGMGEPAICRNARL